MCKGHGASLSRGPHIDRLAAIGNPEAFKFSKPHIPGLDYSFSGLKTSFLYTLRDNLKSDPDFVEHNKADLAASLQKTIIDILLNKLGKALKEHPVRHIAIGGGVSANSGVREAVADFCKEEALQHGFLKEPSDRQCRDGGSSRIFQIYFKTILRSFPAAVFKGHSIVNHSAMNKTSNPPRNNKTSVHTETRHIVIYGYTRQELTKVIKHFEAQLPEFVKNHNRFLESCH